ncbi:MAG: hypothetical protein JXM70_02220 [Pirellulales bacterium]|nr:hypothetical protein [Pirellulales bacterium]
MRRIIVFLLLLGMASLSCPAVLADPPKKKPVWVIQKSEAFRYPEATHGKGQLQYRDGLPVLVVEGTPKEIGQQIGVLGGRPAMRVIKFPREILKNRGAELLYPMLYNVGKSMYSNFPQHHKIEFDAIVESSGGTREELIIINTIDNITRLFGCSSLAVEANRSKTNSPILGRNFDFPNLGYLQNYTLVTIYRPEGKHAFASIGFPGLLAVLSGINDAGLSLVTHAMFSSADGSPPFTSEGTPVGLLLRRILEECETVEEAEKLLCQSKRTTYMTVVVCDKRRAVAIEITPKSVCTRPAERGMLFTTNHFLCDDLKTGNGQWRYRLLEKNQNCDKLGIEEIARQMHAVNQGSITMHTMIFEPESLKMRLAFGKLPSSAQPLVPLELGPLFEAKSP